MLRIQPILSIPKVAGHVRTLGTSARNFLGGLVAGRSSRRRVLSARVRDMGLGAAPNGLDWRRAVTGEDVGRVRSLVARTSIFNAAEVQLAADLVTERLSKGTRSGYQFVLVERGASLPAFACYGPIWGTQDSFELFWIAVAPKEQRKGLGAEIYARAEADMAKAGAKRIYADTSSSDRYASTRSFYKRMGFREGARLPDFYAPGDGKIVYVKDLPVAAG